MLRREGTLILFMPALGVDCPLARMGRSIVFTEPVHSKENLCRSIPMMRSLVRPKLDTESSGIDGLA
jgi:hypothetical protein